MKKAAVYRFARIILTAIYLFAAALMQCSVFPHIRLLSVIPDFALCAVVCVSCFEEKRVFTVLAVAVGFLLDIAGAATYVISPVLFLLSAVIACVMSEKFPSLRLLSAAAGTFFGSALSSVICAAILKTKGAPFFEAVLCTALPQLLYTAIVFAPVYLLTKLHYTVFRNEKR